jgi:hypothetical protein
MPQSSATRRHSGYYSVVLTISIMSTLMVSPEPSVFGFAMLEGSVQQKSPRGLKTTARLATGVDSMPEFTFEVNANELQRYVLEMSRYVVRPIVIQLLAAFFVAMLAAQRGHNHIVWFFASLLDPFLAVSFAARDAGRWRRRQADLQSAVEAGKFGVLADFANPFPDFGPAATVPTIDSRTVIPV